MKSRNLPTHATFYESLFNNMLDGLAYCHMVFDPQGHPVDFTYITVNKNFEKFTGLKGAEGKNVTELVPGITSSNPELFEIYGRVSLSGKTEQFETYVAPLSRWFFVSVYCPRKKFFVAVFQNITDRKRIENDLASAKIAARNVLEDLQTEKEALAHAKAKDEAMLASIGDGVIILDLNGKITFINQSAQNLLGWGSAEILGRLLIDVVPAEDERGNPVSPKARPVTVALAKGVSVWEEGEHVSTTPKSTPGIYYYVRKDKTKFPVAMNFSRVVLAGKVIGAIEVFRDITKEREIDHAKSEFVSLASHQLRTPLTTVNWYSEMLLKGGTENTIEKQKEYLAKIHMGSERMVTLVNALLNVSRIELGTLVVESKPVSITQILQEVVNEQQQQIDEKKIHIVSDFPKDIPMLATDPNLLRMVFQNLLSNAVKYSASASTVSISASIDKDGTILIVFSDTGYGIPKKDHDKIFTKMFRADNIKEKGTEGTGLGLYIVKSVLAALGGTIRFESEDSKGSRFFVSFPSGSVAKRDQDKVYQSSK